MNVAVKANPMPHGHSEHGRPERAVQPPGQEDQPENHQHGDQRRHDPVQRVRCVAARRGRRRAEEQGQTGRHRPDVHPGAPVELDPRHPGEKDHGEGQLRDQKRLDQGQPAVGQRQRLEKEAGDERADPAEPHRAADQAPQQGRAEGELLRGRTRGAALQHRRQSVARRGEQREQDRDHPQSLPALTPGIADGRLVESSPARGRTRSAFRVARAVRASPTNGADHGRSNER